MYRKIDMDTKRSVIYKYFSKYRDRHSSIFVVSISAAVFLCEGQKIMNMAKILFN